MATKISQYEGMFLVGTNFTADVDGALKLVRGTIEKHGGEILVIKKWDERKLAYEIGKAKRGLFVIAYFKLNGGNVTALERDVKLSEDYIRVLVTKADHLTVAEMEAVEPQPIAPPQPERAPWDMPPMGMGLGGNDRPERPSRPRKRDEEAAVGKD